MMLVQAQAYRQQYGSNVIFLLPVNLYGPGDNFDPETSHVIPAMIRRFVEAVETGAGTVTCWGTGAPTREFLHVRDCASGVVRAASRYDGAEPVNLGTGTEISIRDLARTIAEITGFEGAIEWDASKPDGQPRRRLDTTRASALFGWCAGADFASGLRETIAYFRDHARDHGHRLADARP